MARAQVPTKQFKLMLPKELWGHIDQRSLRGTEKQLQCIAGLVAFEFLDPVSREEMVERAQRVVRGEDTWAEVVKEAKTHRGLPASEKELRTTIELLLTRARKVRADRRPA